MADEVSMHDIPSKSLEIGKKHLKIVSYLTLSGGLGYVLATYVLKDPMLTAAFAPAINYILWAIEKEIKGEGYIKIIRNQ